MDRYDDVPVLLQSAHGNGSYYGFTWRDPASLRLVRYDDTWVVVVSTHPDADPVADVVFDSLRMAEDEG
jgi:hypothetical protein